ncbi:MAG: HD domain-containing protein [Hahellaceae bacterium]|nr:HD domain-containing protein [Hahellaceae bacterium]
MEIAIFDSFLSPYDKLIMDPVHGGIPLFEHEVAIIDHSLFQRLRNICQNDILSLVFPGATHSRFLHSIGVMHVGGRMFRSVVDSYLKEKKATSGKYVTGAQLESITYFIKVVRIACLLHDCGHSSFSHQFSKTSVLKALMASPNLFTDLWEAQRWEDFYDTIPPAIEHEHLSVRCAYQILKETRLENFGIEICDVLGIMETTCATPSRKFRDHANEFWKFITSDRYHQGEDLSPAATPLLLQNLLKSIVSGEFDADRADYMLRDSFHSSVTIGGYSLDHLLSNLRIGWDLQQPWLGLAISAKGLGALEDFVFSRHQMYRQVYGHKTAIGFDWILREAITEVMQDQEVRNFVEDCLRNVKNFVYLTDSYFWECFRRYSKKHPDSYSTCIVDRIKLKHIDTKYDIAQDEIDQLKQTYADTMGIPLSKIVTCTMHARFSKIKANFEQMKVLTREPITKIHRLKRITEMSNFFDKFSDETIVHFYVNPI